MHAMQDSLDPYVCHLQSRAYSSCENGTTNDPFVQQRPFFVAELMLALQTMLNMHTRHAFAAQLHALPDLPLPSPKENKRQENTKPFGIGRRKAQG